MEEKILKPVEFAGHAPTQAYAVAVAHTPEPSAIIAGLFFNSATKIGNTTVLIFSPEQVAVEGAPSFDLSTKRIIHAHRHNILGGQIVVLFCEDKLA